MLEALPILHHAEVLADVSCKASEHCGEKELYG